MATQVHFWSVFKEIYIQSLKSRSPGSEFPANVRKVLDRFGEYLGLATRRLNTIDNLDLANYLARRRQDKWRSKPLADRTLNNELAILNACFAYAGPRMQRGPGRANLALIEHPPYIELLPDLETEPIAVEPERLRDLIEATRYAVTPKISSCRPQEFWIAALLLGLISSLRRRALLQIPRPSDYDLLDRRVLSLPAALSKTRRYQVIPLGGEEVVNLLARLPSKPGEPLLPWKNRDGTPMTLGHFTHTLKSFQKLAGIDRTVRLKDLRSTAATEISEEFNDGLAKKRLGHSAHTNTLETNYKAKRVSPKDVEVSEFLAELAMPTIRIQQAS